MTLFYANSSVALASYACLLAGVGGSHVRIAGTRNQCILHKLAMYEERFIDGGSFYFWFTTASDR